MPSDAQLCKKVISSTLCAQQLSAALKNTKEYQKNGTTRIENKLELLTNLNNPELVYGTLNGSKIGYTSKFKRRSHKGKAELRQLVLSNIGASEKKIRLQKVGVVAGF